MPALAPPTAALSSAAGRILAPQDAVSFLLDPRFSPVVALDTEFDSSVPVCRSPLHGLSMAGGNPRDGFVATFWPFGRGYEAAPWAWLRERVLEPIFGDPARTVVMHPLKVDMQTLRARGLTAEKTRANLECTMSMAHVYDENLPKGLKDLAWCLLGLPVASYAEVQREMVAFGRQGKLAGREAVKAAWEFYRDTHRKSVRGDQPLDLFDTYIPSSSSAPSAPYPQRVARELPAGLRKAEVEARVAERVRAYAAAPFEAEARRRFEKYGAEDALFTLQLRYLFRQETPKHAYPLVDLETRICHPVVTEMEEAGLRIDVVRLGHIRDRMAEAIEALRVEVIALWGVRPEQVATDAAGEFNPASTDQVADIVWNQWGLRPPPWALQGGALKPKWTRSDGLCRVDQHILRDLAEKGPAQYRPRFTKLLELRSFEKLKGSFVGPLYDLSTADPEHRVHASFWHVGARTGRFTSDEPNVENVPRASSMPLLAIPAGADPRTPPPGVVVEEKKGVVLWRIESLRNVFIPPDDYLLVSADLSQIENRLTAHESQDPVMLALYRAWECAACGGSGETNEPLHICPSCGSGEGSRDKEHPDQPARAKWKCACGAKGVDPKAPSACPKCSGKLEVSGFCLGRDIHAATSVFLGFNVKYGPKDGRQRSKTINHAFTYGMGAPTMARRDGMTVADAQEYLDTLRARYAAVPRLHKDVEHRIFTDGYVTMWDGHVRRFPVAKLLDRSGNFPDYEKEAVVREGVNVLAQGGTGALMKRAMLAIRERFLRHANPLFRLVRLINQIHDELLYEAPKAIAAEVLAIMSWELEHAAKLTVPVIAEGGTGTTWGRAHA